MNPLFEERLCFCAECTEQALDRLLPATDGAGYADRLLESMRYSALGGGKRLRAYLVLEFCRLCGGDPANALDYAAGIEMMHAFSLIHDDLPAMDNDTLRRGKPTNHVIYGEATALLAGDALSLRACETVAGNPRLSDAQNLQAVRLLSSLAGALGMCGGQQIDLQSEHRHIPHAQLETLVEKKTGCLFAAACMLGCIAANADATLTGAADRFGRLTGLAFQIADDLLDLRATAETLGKTPGKDAQSEKSTFPGLIGISEAEAWAQALCREAQALLTQFPSGRTDAGDSLAAYCDFVTERTR